MARNKGVRVIQSIQRAIDIINCFNEAELSLSLNEISEKLSLHINTTRGIVNTLVYNGFLRYDPIENKYSLGLIFISKAKLVSLNSVDEIRNIVRPYLTKLANKYQVSARLQLVSQHDNIFTVDTVNPEDTRYMVMTKPYKKFPLNATSSGKLYLYFSDKEYIEKFLENLKEENHVRYTEKTILNREDLEKELEFIEKNGYSIEDEEINIGISSLAVPIFNKNNKFIGTISVTATSGIIDKIHHKVVVDMKKASEDIKEKFNIDYNV